MHKLVIFVCSCWLLVGSQNAHSALPLSVRPFSAATVNDFLLACKIHPNTCIDEVGSALLHKINFNSEPEICPTSVDYAAAVPRWLSAHPETSQMQTEDGIYLALKTLYPCA
jgi:hypothetical protein